MKNKLITRIIAMSRYAFYTLLTLTICFGSLLASESSAQKPKSIKEVAVEIDLDNATLLEALKAIEKKTPYRFMYDVSDLNNTLRVDYHGGTRSLY